MRTGSGENIILIGMPTAGKSTVGVVLAKQLGYDYIDTDLLIQQQEGCRLEEIIRSRGDEAFLDIEAGVCSALRCVRTVIATGGSVIYRAQAMEHLRTLGTLVYLQIDRNSLRERLQDAAARGVVLKPGQTVDGLYRERVGLYERYADLRVDESGKHFEDVVRAVLSALGVRTFSVDDWCGYLHGLLLTLGRDGVWTAAYAVPDFDAGKKHRLFV